MVGFSNSGEADAGQNVTEVKLHCFTQTMVRVLRVALGENSTEYLNLMQHLNMSCLNNSSNTSDDVKHHHEAVYWRDVGWDVHAFITPFLILIGIVGNILSGAVFLSRPMRSMSASVYLSSLAAADTIVLLVYVLIDWLNKGISRWPPSYAASPNILQFNGMCHAYVYISYVARLMSAYIVTAFIIERYIGICKPLYRRQVSSSTFARRTVFSLLIVTLLFCLYKPIISTVRVVGGTRICAYHDGYENINFILEGIYGAVLTALPIATITILNILIVRQLFRTRKRRALLSAETVMKIESTVIILVISTAFVLLNLPYFIVWCINYHHKVQGTYHPSDPSFEKIRAWLVITKTIFYFNYSFNFFLYSLSGGVFRKHLKGLFGCNCKPTHDPYRFSAIPVDTTNGTMAQGGALSVSGITGVTSTDTTKI